MVKNKTVNKNKTRPDSSDLAEQSLQAEFGALDLASLSTEELYRSLVEGIGIGISVITPNMRILSANAQMRKWYAQVDFSRHPCCHRVYNDPPREVICAYCPVAKTFKDGLIHEAVTDTPSGGEVRHFHIVSSPIKDAQGRVVAVTEVVDEITARVRMEKELQWSAEVNAALAQVSNALIASAAVDEMAQLVLDCARQLTGSPIGFTGYVDPRTGDFVVPTLTSDVWDTCQVIEKQVVFEKLGGLAGWGINQRLPVLANHPKNDPRSSGVPPGHVPIDRYLSAPAMVGELLMGQVALANSPRDYTDLDLHVLQRLANLFAVAVQHWRIKEDLRRANEELEQKVKERTRALAESENHYRSLTEAAQDNIFVVARDDTLKYVNSWGARTLRQSPENLIGQRRANFFPPETAKRQGQSLEKVFQSGQSSYIEDISVFPEGQVWLSTWLIPLKNDQGETDAVLGVSRDITTTKRAEEELAQKAEELARSNAELENFAYIASHDLQEPLRMVASFAELLGQRYRDQLDDKAREFIGYIDEGTQRMKLLIDDLLTYSRLGRKKEWRPTDLNTVLDRALFNLALLIEETGAEITRNPLPTVHTDPVQMLQVFQNLIGNALKFRAQSRPQVQIGAQEDENEWVFSVRDQGIGIAPEYAERIFLMFQRLHSRSQYPGTGIGLALCKKIVENHKGRIWVESQEGQGATFYFTIPK